MKTAQPAYIVNAPIEFVQHLHIQSQQKPKIYIDTAVLKQIIEGFINMLQSYYEESLKLSPEDVKAMMKEISIPPVAFDTSIDLQLHDLDIELQAPLLELAQLSTKVHKRLLDIANTPSVDEGSEDYQRFLSDMAQEEIEKEGQNRVMGENKLWALFD